MASLTAFIITPGAAPVPDSPRTLGTKLGFAGRRLHMADLDIGHLERHRRDVIGHGAVLELARIVIDAVLVERAAEALYAAAADLFVGKLRVDDAAAILDHPVLQMLDPAGIDIDLDIRAVNAVGIDVG